MEITELGELAQVHDVDDRKLLGESGLTTVGDLKVSALRVLDESSLLQVSPSPAEAVGENFLVPTRRGGTACNTLSTQPTYLRELSRPCCKRRGSRQIIPVESR